MLREVALGSILERQGKVAEVGVKPGKNGIFFFTCIVYLDRHRSSIGNLHLTGVMRQIAANVKQLGQENANILCVMMIQY